MLEPLVAAPVFVSADDPMPLLLMKKKMTSTAIATTIATMPNVCASLRTELFTG